MKRDNPYLKIGATAFLVVVGILLFYDILFGARVLVTFALKFLNAMKPIFYGAAIAYLLAPVVDWFERWLFPKSMEQATRAGKFFAKWPRVISLLLTWFVILVCGYVLLSILLPEVYRSIVALSNNMETYYNTVNGWITQLLEINPGAESWVVGQMDTYYQEMIQWVSDKALPHMQQVMTAVSGGVMTVVVFLKNLVVGVIVSIYLLASKERWTAQCRKITRGLFSSTAASWLFRGTRKVDAIFSGFVRGKLLDSLIIGVITFIFCRITHMPYTPLVSVIIGVTNIIPFFGPFLGAIPSLFLILLVSPMQALYFLLFVIALQQVDGNIIGPKILGDSTGLSALWVIVAILLGGSFFGIPGMFFGVPVFACFYAAAKFFVEYRLQRKNLPLKDRYYTYEGGQPIKNDKKQTKPTKK